MDGRVFVHQLAGEKGRCPEEGASILRGVRLCESDVPPQKSEVCQRPEVGIVHLLKGGAYIVGEVPDQAESKGRVQAVALAYPF